MTSIVESAVNIQTTSESHFSPPSRARSNRREKPRIFVRTAFEAEMNEQVRFARKRFGRVCGDRFSGAALWLRQKLRTHAGKVPTFGSNRLPSRSWPGRERERLPSRSALSRFASSIDRGTRRSPTHPVDFPICSVAHSPLPPPRSKPEAW
jgi:hypothetical protein